MEVLKDFCVASVGASAALVGLLFVSITLAPESFFGRDADLDKHAKATGAFIALANVFFVSLAGLIPQKAAWIVAVVALVSVFQIGRKSIAMARLFPDRRGWHHFGLMSLCIYLLECALAVRVAFVPDSVTGVAYTVLGLYGYALGTCWTLIGVARAAPNE